MTYKELAQSLEARNFQPVYLFYGDEVFVKARALARLRELIVSPEVEALNESILSGASAEAIIAEAEMLPFLCERRLVVVRDFAPLISGRARDESAEAQRLADWLPNAPATCCLVFDVRGGVDMRKKLTSALQKQACCVCFDPLDEPDLIKWIAREAKGLGKQIAPADASHLIFMAGRDLTRIIGELGKLAAFVGDRPQIALADMERAVTPTLECTVFQMIDRLTEGNAPAALSMLKELLEQGEQPVGVLAMIARQARLLTHARLLLDTGANASQIEKTLEISRYVATRVLAQARRFEADYLSGWYDACVQADYAIKSGKVRDEDALSRLFLALLDKRQTQIFTSFGV